uniref:Cyclin C n=1 Tax=Ficedula albicollis TaxID=59894 RepID=A0A803W9B1_FICAL
MEFGVVSNTRLISAATSVLKTRFSYAFPKEFPYRMNHILECEFYLLELMDCCLIVYHPYRPLLQYVQDMGQEDMLLPLAWRIVNDTYRTDLCLLYPPFMIALACLHVACVVQQKDARQWFAELSVDMEKILEIIRVILKLYEQWKNFDERKEMATILSKMPKPKPPPNRYGTLILHLSYGKTRLGIVYVFTVQMFLIQNQPDCSEASGKHNIPYLMESVNVIRM